jgi:hypothetical protein
MGFKAGTAGQRRALRRPETGPGGGLGSVVAGAHRDDLSVPQSQDQVVPVAGRPRATLVQARRVDDDHDLVAARGDLLDL